MKLKFTKMHGAGNDFVVLDGVRQQLALTPHIVRWLADRHLGIGADQILVVERPTVADADFRYRIFNADGAEVEHCGNGARCFAKFVHESGLTDKCRVRAQIQKGVLTLVMQEDGEVTVEMGTPEFDTACIAFNATGLSSRIDGTDCLWPLQVNDKLVWLSLVSMGNPHAVQAVEDIDTAPVLQDGPCIEAHPRFLTRVNASFMQIIDHHTIRLRVYERGVGETLACGTAACAAVVAGIRRQLLTSPVKVHMRGGQLTISWHGDQVQMTGPAVKVFEGEIELTNSPQ